MDHRNLESAYESNTFGLTRRAFVALAATAGVSAAGGMLVFPDQKASAAFTPAPATPSWPSFSDGKVRFTVHSDTHVGAGSENSYRDKIPAAFAALYSATNHIDAHFFVGDSADMGHPDQYTELAELLNANAKKPIGMVMGNHEYYNWGGDKEKAQAEFKTFLSSKLQVAGSFQIPGGTNEGQTDCNFIIGGNGTAGSGYHVIAASAHPGGYDNSWYGDRQDWFRAQIAAAVAEDATKPVFLFTHHPFGNTVWYSEGGSWNGQFGTDRADRSGNDMAFYRELAASYPQIIHFSGHTHIPMVDPRSIYQDDGFTLIQTATFANNFWMAECGADDGGSTGGHPDAGQDANECELVEIDPSTNVVTIYRMDFRNGAILGTPWTIDPRAGTAGFRYTHGGMEARSLAPIAESNASVTIPEESITTGSASFSLTADKVSPNLSGLEDDVVMAYRIEVYDIASQNTLTYDARFMTDYYKAAANQPAAFIRPLFGATLSDDSDYLVRAYAQNAFGKESLIGETTFHTAVKTVPALEEPLLSVDFSTGSHADASATGHTAVPTGSLSYETEPSFGVDVARFDGASAVGYDFSSADYAAIAQSETIEVLFQFSEAPTGSGYFDLFSSAQNAGQDLSYYGPLDPSSDNPLHANPLLHQYMNVGSGYQSTNAVVLPGVWHHLITTFDGQTMKYYLDGQLVSQLNNSGSIPAPSATPTRWYVGADTDSSGKAEVPMKGKIAFARLTPGVAIADQVESLYTESAPVSIAAAAPDPSAIGTATVGTSYAIPTVSFVDVSGNEVQAIPLVSGPTGNNVDVVKGAQAASTIETLKQAAGEKATYRFTPDSEGIYTVVYQAGYAHRPSFALEAKVAPVNPDPDPNPNPNPTPGDDTGGHGGSTGGDDQKAGQKEIVDFTSKPKSLAKTGDSNLLGTALIGLAATAGAAAYVAKGLISGKFSEDEDSSPRS